MNNYKPLAERMRPSTLDEFSGQQHLVGKEGILRRIVQSGNIPSMIFWGPPGVGKTTLANIIAAESGRPFHVLSAIHSGVKDVRNAIESASEYLKDNPEKGNPVLFIDEIHRFSKSQQDSLLGAVEKGTVTLMGATTENPSFEVIPALLSRCQTYVLNDLGKAELLHIIDMAMHRDAYLKEHSIRLEEHDALLRLSGGDARKLLNLFELVVRGEESKGEVIIRDKTVMHYAQQQTARYDKSGEQHYDVISAFIKSIRGSDPNAALYWLARMIAGGEDPTFIARRLVILASEDIGNANPTALVIACSCFDAVKVIGFPESRIILSQAVTYLASSPKSNAAVASINMVASLVERTGYQPVPLHLRNAPTRLMKDLGYGEDYQYSHLYSGNFSEQEYMPETLSGTRLFEPGNNPRENEIRNFLKNRWKDKYGY
jgi:putative ATPase